MSLREVAGLAMVGVAGSVALVTIELGVALAIS